MDGNAVIVLIFPVPSVFKIRPLMDGNENMQADYYPLFILKSDH